MALKKVTQVKESSRDITSNTAVAMTDEIFESMNRGNKLLAMIAESYIANHVVQCGQYEDKYYIDGVTIDAIKKALL